MKYHRSLFISLIMLALLLSACAPAVTEAMEAEPVMEVKPDAAMMEEPAATGKEMEPSEPASMEEPADPVMESLMQEAPAWFGAALTNVNTGETFTINAYQGKVVLVETMAQWCSNCKKQQQELKALLEDLGPRDDFVAVVLDIDPNESAETLKAYAAENGFDWVYAVAPADVSRELSNLYGANFINPPSTPILIIDRAGEAHPLRFGIKSAAELMESLQPYLENM